MVIIIVNMATIITKMVNGCGPYRYRVTYENGKHKWEYLGKVERKKTATSKSKSADLAKGKNDIALLKDQIKESGEIDLPDETLSDGMVLAKGPNIDIEPAGNIEHFKEPEPPNAAAPEKHGRGYIDVKADTNDFKQLQSYIGTNFGPGGPVSRKDWWAAADQENVNQMATAIENGEKLPMPWVEMNGNGELTSTQEGRHRALAAKKAGLEKIPFRIVITPNAKGATDKSVIPKK